MLHMKFCSPPCIKHTGLHFSCITIVSWQSFSDGLKSQNHKNDYSIISRSNCMIYSKQKYESTCVDLEWFPKARRQCLPFLNLENKKGFLFHWEISSHLQHFVRSVSIFAHLLLMEWLLSCQKLLRLSSCHPTDELRLHCVWTLSLFASRCL